MILDDRRKDEVSGEVDKGDPIPILTVLQFVVSLTGFIRGEVHSTGFVRVLSNWSDVPPPSLCTRQ